MDARRGMSAEKHDRSVVRAFAEHLRECGMADVQVDHWLEDECPGTSQPEAIVGPFVVEHTSIDTFESQRRDGARFSEIVSSLEAALSPFMPGHVRVHLPFDTIAPGRDWAALRLDIAASIVTEVRRLPDGVYDNLTIPNPHLVPRLSKQSRGVPRLICWLVGDKDEKSLPDRLREQVEAKAKKLSPFLAKGKTRVL